MWFKNRRAKYRKLKGSKETGDLESKDDQETIKKRNADDDDLQDVEGSPVGDEAHSYHQNKRLKVDRDLEDSIAVPTRPVPLSSGYVSSPFSSRSFPFDPRLLSGYGYTYVPEWVYYDSVNNCQPRPVNVQQLYPNIGVIHWVYAKGFGVKCNHYLSFQRNNILGIRWETQAYGAIMWCKQRRLQLLSHHQCNLLRHVCNFFRNIENSVVRAKHLKEVTEKHVQKSFVW